MWPSFGFADCSAGGNCAAVRRAMLVYQLTLWIWWPLPGRGLGAVGQWRRDFVLEHSTFINWSVTVCKENRHESVSINFID